MTDPKIKVVMMDIYDCRSESDFYERFAASIIKGVAGKVENMIAYVREFLGRFSAKVSVSPDPSLDYSLSFGISPKDTDDLESSSADSIKEGSTYCGMYW